MIEAVSMMGGLGLVVGAGLAVASKVFYVYVDPLIEAIEGALPGANCGGCGVAGCSANAVAIAAGKSAPTSCVAAGPEVAEAIAVLLGVSVEVREPNISRLGCTYSVREADVKYIYDGLSDCRAAALLSGGMKVCGIGCLGLGSCVRACLFNALDIGPNGLPVVNEKNCTGCGACEKVCPKHIITLSSVTRRILREYTTEDCTTPCQRACPAGINISEYIRLISIGDFHRSVQIIKERNPFPTVIGRICPRPCETECRRQYVDEPVAINYLKRFAADYEKSVDKHILPYRAPASGKKIAVIGGGVEGLSTAFFSTRLGHDVTVFEAAPQLGGLLRTAIARNRLPLDILDWDIQGILNMGVHAETSKALGADFTLESLFSEGYEAVFMATGGWDSRLARGAGQVVEHPFPGLFLLIDFAGSLQQDGGKMADSPVVIAGGGNMGLDMALLSKAQGVKEVVLLLRESKQSLPFAQDNLEKLEASGITVIYRAAITRIKGKGGSLVALETTNLDSGEKLNLPAGTLVIPSGRFPEMIVVRSEADQPEAAATAIAWEAFEPYKKPDFHKEIGWISENDVLSDFSGAIKAIAAGRRSAASIHQSMYSIPLSFSDQVVTPETLVQNVDHVENVENVPRRIMPLCKSLSACSEIEKGFTQEMAVSEASRCLQCGLICYKQAARAQENAEMNLSG
ncbi:MAG: FAD-dependent oxidoreductase [Desulfatirhabdiaceae bacterium]|nr:FAD-dependent oxidoreductase [Desulfatirhabdiaceae bacterium]